MPDKTISVNYLARVEGEGSLTIRFSDDGRPCEAQLAIFEPPRFFEAFLRGRSQLELPDITARICGICPVAYQMSSSQAIEAIVGSEVTGMLRELRRLLYYGEWIESHVLHIFMLHAPDFLGYPDALALAKDHPALVKRALRLKKIGNAIMILLGGREIHPINPRVGGFWQVPTKGELQKLLPDLHWGLAAMQESLSLLAELPYPNFERDYEFVSLRHPTEYPLLGERIVSSQGLDLALTEWDEFFVEEQVERSNALHSLIKGRGSYLVGPLSRFNLNFNRLAPAAQEAARLVGLSVPCRNPFKSLLVRAVETVQALAEAIAIVERYEPPAEPQLTVSARAGTGAGCTEAPRGILYHHYAVDDAGIIQEAKIVPPTAQNLRTMEADLLELAPQLAELPHHEAVRRAEQAIRNFDPCISCATHLLQLRFER
ncbi:MAG: Ni/Fe hydrogenase subunit alpha [Cyanobacteria bacterium NC_groundwater_1444_Ag_S-0.65um_54_12]|nr:Ni/Fe hydrogenase subunit alpha [Cyanobacteria bacterium NC_groundwater_1444_Ag_S-0.65um_54_12]